MKKWKIGDKVKFLNETGGGKIVVIKNDNEVIVLTNDGLEIPYPSNQLIPDNKNIILNSSSQTLNENITDNKILFLAIESNNVNVSNASEFYFYLYNLSDYNFYYTYSVGKSNHFQCLAHGNIQAYEKQRIKTLSSYLLKEIDVHQIQIIFYQDKLYPLQNPVFETFKLNEKNLTPSHFISHPEFEKPVYILILKENFSQPISELIQQHSPQNIKIHLEDEDLKKIAQLKEKIYYPKKKPSTKSKYQEEIVMDLHIEEIVDNPALLTPHQKLQIQLDYFERELHDAIANNVKKITIIHGVGNGRLKYEVREYLKTLDEVKEITDAPYKTHGFGATIVYIK